VWIATLRGIGQSAALGILFGAWRDPVALNLAACLIMPLSFIAGLSSGISKETASPSRSPATAFWATNTRPL
jgi:hypothetical protein